MSPNFSDNTNMDTIDFKKLSEQLRSELLRVNGWRKVVRTGSIAVYLFVFCWFMFVLFGGALVSYIGLENYMQFTQYIIPVFIGFIVVNFVFTRCMTNFQERESHNFRGMFGWCKIDKRFKGNIIILPDHLEQKIGYLAKNIQGLKKRYSARLVQLED